ncbi:hypothetical protein [Kribbella sp. NPDC004875]|uniref:hypothetical protein n=1 Tax=Kribbella sp. NPDC004875 TaxID=3364107 RepID=UPI0036BD9FD4
MTQPPNQPYGPPNSGWQQQPPNQPPGFTQPPYGGPGPGAPSYGPGYGPGGPGYGPGGPGGPRPRRTLLYAVLGVIGVLVLLTVGILATRLASDDDTAGGPTQPSTAPSRPNPTAEPTSVPSGGPSGGPTPSTTTATTPAAAPRLTEATALATRFLAYVNAADRTHALALGCEDSRKILDGLLVFMIDPPTKLVVNGKPYATQTYYPKISVPFSGTTKGPVPRTGTVDIMDQPPAQLCVRLTTMR